MFRDRLQLSTSEATEDGLEKELSDLMLPDMEPPGVEGGVMKLNCSCLQLSIWSYSSSVFLLSKMTLFILSTTSSICSTSLMRLTSWRTTGVRPPARRENKSRSFCTTSFTLLLSCCATLAVCCLRSDSRIVRISRICCLFSPPLLFLFNFLSTFAVEQDKLLKLTFQYRKT